MAKLLLVEDEPDHRKIIKIRLETRNYQVLTAENAEDGIKLAQEEKPDLILMDIILPGMHGLDATLKLKKIPETRDIPIIALTAVNTPDFKHTCLQSGVCDFIEKLYEPEELFEKIKKNIGKKQRKNKK